MSKALGWCAMPLSSARDADSAVPWSVELLALLSRNAPRQQHLAPGPESDKRRRVLAAAALEARVRVRLAVRCTAAEQRPHRQPPVFAEPPVPLPTAALRPAANLRLLVNHQYGLAARARARARERGRLERSQQQLVAGEPFDMLQQNQDNQHAAGAEGRGEIETRALPPELEVVSSESEPVEPELVETVEEPCSTAGGEGGPCSATDILASSNDPAALMQPSETGSDAELEHLVGEANTPDGLALETTLGPLLRQRSKPQPFLECDARRALMSRLRLQLR